MDRIVLGVDGSEGAAAAIDWCASRLPGRAAEVVAVHAVAPIVTLVPPAGTPPPLVEAASHEALDEYVRRLCEPLETAGIPWRVRVVDRPAAIGLEEVAAEEGAVMIVVGRRGRPGALAGVMGSVPRRLAQHAPCAVLIVPEVAA
jgi:nucleotide-binding universal stress UspA family protein